MAGYSNIMFVLVSLEGAFSFFFFQRPKTLTSMTGLTRNCQHWLDMVDFCFFVCVSQFLFLTYSFWGWGNAFSGFLFPPVPGPLWRNLLPRPMLKQLVFDECLMKNAMSGARHMDPGQCSNSWFLMNASCKMQCLGLAIWSPANAQTAGF